MIECNKCKGTEKRIHVVLGQDITVVCECVKIKKKIKEAGDAYEKFLSLTDPKEIYEAEELINNACKKQAPDYNQWA